MVCARRTGVGRVPWLGGPGRQELAFNGIFEPPKVRARRAPRLALPVRCERLTMRSLSGAARPAHPVGWLDGSIFECPGPRVLGPLDRHLGWSGRRFCARSDGTQPPRALEFCA